MNVFLSVEAQAAFRHAAEGDKRAVERLLARYSAYRNRHAIPGRSTLSGISAQARAVLRLAPGTRVFECRERR
jgi:hypothetical protein